ncbi:MAG: YidC/Oxa1 family membrane protein insertase [Clostridia bacterium]|nr:YidC/Oxa1 family membrane protein insertase [Clostridia bacterium]MBQ6937704.1 YidC/Oxa1 family membrane protein insertase [Clostridia bacterium]MBR2884582.1 YidC/Oxa1 family membrane protein insertase [Clostridia bacterium]
MYILAEPLAFLTRLIYNLIENYGITLIIVTILIRVLTIPLTVMSQKSTAKTQLIQPELQKLQQKYKNDKEKLSIEMQKLYKKHDVNPMGGCLPLIVQMFVLFGFIRVVYDPLRYILQLSVDQIDKIKEAVGATVTTYQVTLCGMEGVSEQIIALGKKPINFDFLGIDLTRMVKGNETDLLVWIFPVLAVLATIWSAQISKKQMQTANNGANEQAQSMSNSMMTIMPIMTAFFTYTMPIGMSLYWFVSTVAQIIQQAVITKVVNKELENKSSERKDKR